MLFLFNYVLKVLQFDFKKKDYRLCRFTLSEFEECLKEEEKCFDLKESFNILHLTQNLVQIA